MGSPTTPTHGKLGALYVLRPNGFNGAGLNDLTWGTGFTGAATAYYEVVIDAEAATDTFKWRKNGGAWTAGVAITGLEQTLDEGQKLTFAAVTGHTLADQWVIGNLKAEATSESGASAQITAAANRLLNPNAPPTFTDDGGETVESINYTNGTAYFTGNVGNVTVAGNNGYVPAAALQKVGYLIDWNLSLTLDMADCSRVGQQWKEALPGLAGGDGGANAWFIATETLYNVLAEAIAAGEKYFLLQLFNYDPDQDQTGDHINAWVSFTAFNLTAAIAEVVKEGVSFQVVGAVSFTADT
ncbi:MAG: hypothetical protein PHW08_07145 [Kiritimatiellae bacterium]|nr:hypothetical protein [Kiritimatiellia bacterium]